VRRPAVAAAGRLVGVSRVLARAEAEEAVEEGLEGSGAGCDDARVELEAKEDLVSTSRAGEGKEVARTSPRIGPIG
jgi:hypothetical protein